MKNGMEYIRSRYQVPAKRGMMVKYKNSLGVITSADGAYVRIRLDGETKSKKYHPLHEIKYLIPDVIKDEDGLTWCNCDYPQLMHNSGGRGQAKCVVCSEPWYN